MIHIPVIASEMMENCPSTVHTTSIKTLFLCDMNYYNMMGGLLCLELNSLDSFAYGTFTLS